MRRLSSQGVEARLPLLRAARCAVGLLAATHLAQAQDADAALAAFVRPAAQAPRGPVPDRETWDALLRPLGQPSAMPRWRAIDEALIEAARLGRDDEVRKLLRAGAAVDRVGANGATALGAAASAGWRTTLRLLLRAGADPAAFGASGQTALHLAALGGQLAAVDEMLKLGVPVDLLNRQRDTALDTAAATNQQAVMDRLLQAGANLASAGRR